ncbi:MAG: electron transfer flavoprotein subunit beta/FixA family protein [Elusimicrobia bacterium]|nr:electron transfer flavoprotein subunit beta/FixA family protein [Elusimicrobiota bacterium]
MHILACIKQTPATSNVQIDPKTGTLKREGMAAAINPFDEYAIEEAVRIKEKVPNTVVSVLTMGPPQAEESLRDAISRGCDQAFHLCDRAFAGADTYATSYALQMGIRKIETVTQKKVDLILCGKQTNDGELDIPNAAYVKKVEEINETMIRVWRMMEDGADLIELPLPALIAVVKEINEPRVPSLRGKMAAKKAVIPRWTAQDIEADKTKIGLGGSPTIVASSFNPPPRIGGVKIGGATAEEKAKNLVAKLLEMKLI